LIRLRFSWLFFLVLTGLTGCGSDRVELLEFDAPPGSSVPRLAVAGETVVLSYLVESDTGVRLETRKLNGAKWSQPTIVAAGPDLMVNWADFPSVVPFGHGLWVAHWLVRAAKDDFAYDAWMSLSRDGGQSWAPASRLHDDRSATEHGFVSLFEQDNDVGAVWLDGRAFAFGNTKAEMQLFTRTISSAGLIGPERILDARVCDCCQTDAAITAEGPIVVYRDRSASEVRDIYAVRQADGHWGVPVRVAEDGWRIAGCPVNGPAISALGADVVVAWFSARPHHVVRLAFSTDSGQHFAQPIEVVAGATLGRVDVELLETGKAVVGWLEKGTGRYVVGIVGREEMSEVHAVIQTASHRGAGFPRMVRWRDKLLFSWTDTSGDQSHVRTASMRL